MAGRLETLLEAAILAPSGDNLQPWRFAIDRDAAAITFLVDESRDPSPMNAGQVMSQIAVGAAVENALRTAQHNGWSAELEAAPPPALARIRLQGGEDRPGAIEDAILTRVSNRRFYDRRPIPEEILLPLQRETPILDGVTTHWIVADNRLAELAVLIGRADALMFGEPSVRRAFLANVRFDAAPDARVQEGLSLASLELSSMDRVALRLMPRIPNWMMKLGATGMFAARARKLVESSSGLCLVVAANDSTSTYLTAGRVMERAWLALTEAGLAVQPMMSLLVLENVLVRGSSDSVSSFGRERLTALREEFRRLAPEIGGGLPRFLLRFGFASAPSGRTGRLPSSLSCTEAFVDHAPGQIASTEPRTERKH